MFRAIRITNQLGGLHEETSPGLLYDMCRFLDEWKGRDRFLDKWKRRDMKCIRAVQTLLDHLMLAIAATFQSRWRVWDRVIRQYCEDDTIVINGVTLSRMKRYPEDFSLWCPQLPSAMLNSPTSSTHEDAQTYEDAPVQEATQVAEDTTEH